MTSAPRPSVLLLFAVASAMAACTGSTGASGKDGADGAAGAAGAAGAKGDTGNTGNTGADGALGIYGDGSAGDLFVHGGSVEKLAAVAASGNLQFASVTIDTGASLYVPSGTVLRVKGTFENRGVIVLDLGVYGAFAFKAGDRTATTAPPSPGIAPGLPMDGQQGPSTSSLQGGRGAKTFISSFDAMVVVDVAARGGGGGAASTPFLGGAAEGGMGGGSLVVLAGQALTQTATGTIHANAGDGWNGGGGGGGGVVLLASRTAVTLAGSVVLKGGMGSSSTNVVAASGGGGGGILRVMSPAIDLSAATIDLAGGAAGWSSIAVANATRAAGAGGGASGGSGGDGASLDTAPGNAQTDQSAGSVGRELTTLEDPTDVL